MEAVKVENLNFTYPDSSSKAIDNISFQINSGEFILVCGTTGSGKTTLLKMLKKEISPNGEKSGKIYCFGKSTEIISDKESSENIGFVFQDVNMQLVTDTVYTELAFGLENLGYDSDVIHRKIGETLSYFGLNGIFNRKINTLSGGEKQLVSLASVMVMSPNVLILDEPTSSLDPINASRFLDTVKKINRELGVTVIISEHRYEEIFPICDRVLIIDHGKLNYYDSPKNLCSAHTDENLFFGFPASVLIYRASGQSGECPLTVSECREFLCEMKALGHLKCNGVEHIKPQKTSDIILSLKNIHYRYFKNSPDVLHGLDLDIEKGEILSLLGANGCGKSTLLGLIVGIYKAYEGKIVYPDKKVHSVSMLMQDVMTMFVKTSVYDELNFVCKRFSVDNAEFEINKVMHDIGISELKSRHPYDLSGGEAEKCAIAKILLTKPDILFLDEPTKGIDPYSKVSLVKLLKTIKSKGVTVIIATHDTEFAAMVSDKCSLLFDGIVSKPQDTHSFFSSMSYFTTQTSRITKGIIDNAILPNEVKFV